MEHTISFLPDRKSKNAPMRHKSVAGINFSGKSAASKISYWVLLGPKQFLGLHITKSLGLYFVFHQRLSSIRGPLPSKVVFHQRLSSIKGCLSSKVVLHQRLSLIKGHLSSKVNSLSLERPTYQILVCPGCVLAP